MRKNVTIEKSITIKCVLKGNVTDMESFIDTMEGVIASKFKSDFKRIDYELEDDTLYVSYNVEVDAVHLHIDATRLDPAEDEIEFFEEFFCLDKVLNATFNDVNFIVTEDSDYKLVA